MGKVRRMFTHELSQGFRLVGRRILIDRVLPIQEGRGREENEGKKGRRKWSSRVLTKNISQQKEGGKKKCVGRIAIPVLEKEGVWVWGKGSEKEDATGKGLLITG